MTETRRDRGCCWRERACWPTAGWAGAIWRNYDTQQAHQAIEQSLVQVASCTGASDANLCSLGPHADLRDTLELDSLDLRNLVEALSERTGRRIDEHDYPQLATMADACCASFAVSV